MEILCARFQSSGQQECLVIWTPNGTTENLETLHDLYLKMSAHFSYPIIFYGWLSQGRQQSIGNQELVHDLELVAPEELKWRMVRLRSEKPKSAKTFRSRRELV